MTVLAKLPSLFQDGEPLPDNIQGATIYRIGTTDADNESGEFVIEYIPQGQRDIWRLLLLFTERGMWVEDYRKLPAIPGESLESECEQRS